MEYYYSGGSYLSNRHLQNQQHANDHQAEPSHDCQEGKNQPDGAREDASPKRLLLVSVRGQGPQQQVGQAIGLLSAGARPNRGAEGHQQEVRQHG
jgi:hypothetical protein